MLRLNLRLGKGAPCPGEASTYDPSSEQSFRAANEPGGSSFLLTLSFEDVRRCHCAELHLKKRRLEVRKRLAKNVEDFIHGLCEQ